MFYIIILNYSTRSAIEMQPNGVYYRVTNADDIMTMPNEAYRVTSGKQQTHYSNIWLMVKRVSFFSMHKHSCMCT